MNTDTVQIFGNYKEHLSDSDEYLTIGFAPGRRPLQKRWENNELSADFIADYYKNFHIDQRESMGDTPDEMDTANLRDGVKYIANELLENAMKFQLRDMGVAAKIALSLYDEEIVFSISNGVDTKQLAIFQAYIERFIASDPQALYFEVMRNSAKEENLNQSGMGLLSMVCDYGASLGWKFSPTDDPERMLVSTMVCLPVQLNSQ
jgi:hypothetical protein